MSLFADLSGLLGLIGLSGLIGLRHPIDKQRSGTTIRLLGLLGLLGLSGFWIAGAGACGAFGSLGLWNHQNLRYHNWARLGPLGLIGIYFLANYLVGTSA